MERNQAFLLTLIIIIFCVGFFVSSQNKFISPYEDDINNILNKIEEETGIDFSETRYAQIDWVLREDPETEIARVAGIGFGAREIPREKDKLIEYFFKKKSFEKDFYNVFKGEISDLVGYKKDRIICTYMTGITGYREMKDRWWVPTDFGSRDVEIRCGILEEDIHETNVDKEKACLSTNGTIKNRTCCNEAGDFPDLCIIGICGCAPAYSREVKICDCGENRCFDGNECVTILGFSEDLACVTKNRKSMGFEKAKQIAENSECGKEKFLEGNQSCNLDTGTWWIAFDIERPGCKPACVIDIEKETAEINWRCTGILD